MYIYIYIYIYIAILSMTHVEGSARPSSTDRPGRYVTPGPLYGGWVGQLWYVLSMAHGINDGTPKVPSGA